MFFFKIKFYGCYEPISPAAPSLCCAVKALEKKCNGLEKQGLIYCIVLGTEQSAWTSTTNPTLLIDASKCSGLWTASSLAVVTSTYLLRRYQRLRCEVVFCM